MEYFFDLVLLKNSIKSARESVSDQPRPHEAYIIQLDSYADDKTREHRDVAIGKILQGLARRGFSLGAAQIK